MLNLRSGRQKDKEKVRITQQSGVNLDLDFTAPPIPDTHHPDGCLELISL